MSGRTGFEPDHAASLWNVDALGLWGPMVGGMQAWNGACGKAAVAAGSEWLDFLSRRMREDLALPQRLAACRRIDEAWQTYAEFWQKAARDFQEELAELARLNSEAMGAYGIAEHAGRTSRDRNTSHNRMS